MRTAYLAAVFAIAPMALAQSVSGLWDATVVVNDLKIPFRMEFSSAGGQFEGSFFNGDERVTSTSGHLDGGKLLLNFAHYGSKLEAALKDGSLSGSYTRDGHVFTFEATPAERSSSANVHAPSIAGMWEIEVNSSKGESAWRFIVRQTGADVSAAILRVDGDTGTLTGTYKDGRFALSHFSGARPSLFVVTPQPDGSLDIVQNGSAHLPAYRPEVARAKGLPEPADPSQFTRVSNPDEPLRFHFPDLNGRMVSNDDARFQGKVVLVSIMGSWCPNCHDEAPFLVDLYNRYHAKGLEIVALSFEEKEQLESLSRARAFVQHYGIQYPVLIPGEPSEVHDKLPQAVNLNSWPTTFFIGRNGLVRSVHAGFPGRASGPLHDQTTAELRSQIEELLAEQLRTSN